MHKIYSIKLFILKFKQQFTVYRILKFKNIRIREIGIREIVFVSEKDPV